jgi:hypothetical protein
VGRCYWAYDGSSGGEKQLITSEGVACDKSQPKIKKSEELEGKGQIGSRQKMAFKFKKMALLC